MDRLSDDVRKLMNIMETSMTTDDIFFHATNQIARQLPRLQRLRQAEERPGQFNEEVAEMAILVAMLRDIGGVPDFMISDKMSELINEANSNHRRNR
ncbi:MAG: hypothetical protein ABIJ92_00865 [Candidatus Aenigmatarchaeota archaeon]